MRTFLALLVGFGLSSCAWLETETVHVLEVDLRLLGGEPSEDGLKAREMLWMVPGKLYAETTTAAAEGQKPTTVRKIFDFVEGVVWESSGDSPYSERGLWELEHILEGQRRGYWMDFVDLYIRASAVRELPEMELYRQYLAVEAGETQASGLFDVRLIGSPGSLVWRLTCARSSRGRRCPQWLRAQLLYRIVGELTVNEARSLATALAGMPLVYNGGVAVAEGQVPIQQHRIVSDTLREFVSSRFQPPARDIARARRLDTRYRDPASILRALREPENRQDDIGDLTLLLRLEDRMEDRFLPELRDLWRTRKEFAFQVECLRLVLRHDSRRAWPLLRAELEGTDGPLALAAAEALIAETTDPAPGLAAISRVSGDELPSPLAMVFDLLGRRRQFAFAPPEFPEIVSAWAIPRIRVHCGLPLAEVARRVGPLWEAGDDVSQVELAARALARETDLWLRWWEQNRLAR